MAKFQQQKMQDIQTSTAVHSSSEAFDISMPRVSRLAIQDIKVEDAPATERIKLNGTKYTIKLSKELSKQDPLIEELPFLASMLQPALGKDQRFTYASPPVYDAAKKEASYVLYPLRSVTSGGDVIEKPREVPSFSQMKFLQVTSEEEVARIRITPHPRLNESGGLNESRRESISKALEEYIGKTYDLENPPAMESSFKAEGKDYILSIKFKKKED